MVVVGGIFIWDLGTTLVSTPSNPPTPTPESSGQELASVPVVAESLVSVVQALPPLTPNDIAIIELSSDKVVRLASLASKSRLYGRRQGQ